MKKIFLLIFVTFCSLIFYQIILGKNGIIEGYRIQKEKEILIAKKLAMMKEIENLNEYINYLKNDPNALKSLAEKLGFYEDDVKLVKILDKLKKEENFVNEQNTNYSDSKSNYQNEDKIKKIRLWISIFFYIFFGLFIFLIIFGIQNKNE
jgi:cell division protein FtsB